MCKFARCGWTTFVDGFRFRAEAIVGVAPVFSSPTKEREHMAACIAHAVEALDECELAHVEEAHVEEFAAFVNAVREAGLHGAVQLLAD